MQICVCCPLYALLLTRLNDTKKFKNKENDINFWNIITVAIYSVTMVAGVAATVEAAYDVDARCVLAADAHRAFVDV